MCRARSSNHHCNRHYSSAPKFIEICVKLWLYLQVTQAILMRTVRKESRSWILLRYTGRIKLRLIIMKYCTKSIYENMWDPMSLYSKLDWDVEWDTARAHQHRYGAII